MAERKTNKTHTCNSHSLPLPRAAAMLKGLAVAGMLAGLASGCASTGPGAASTRAAQTLAMMITEMAGLAPSPSPTSYALPEDAPTATAGPSVTTGPSATPTPIETVPLSISSTPRFRRATYSGSTPTTDPASLLTRTLTQHCNAAFFVGYVPPIVENSEVKAGEPFALTLVIRNVGTCTWFPSYTMYWYRGARFDAPAYIDLPEIVPPNKNMFVTLHLTAPSQTGRFYSIWYLRDPDFNQFGFGLEYKDPLTIWLVVV